MKKITHLLFVSISILPTLVIGQNVQSKITTGAPVANFSTIDTSVCLYQSISFTDLSTNNPTSWKWYFPGGVPDTSTLQNPPLIQYITPGKYSVTLVVKNSSGSDSVTKTNYIHVYAIPSVTFTGADSLCKGSSTVITATNGYTYHWSTGATTSIINVSPTTSTTYTVQVRNGACYKDTTFTIIVDSLPVITHTGSDTLCKGDSITFTVKGAGNYQWFNGNTNSSVTISPPSSATFTVQLTNGACFEDTAFTIIVKNCTGIQNYSDPIGICIFPNPASKQLSLQMDNPINSDATLTISDVTGRLLYSENVTSHQSKIDIDVSSLAPAVYFLKLQTDEGIVVKKFLKE